MGDIFNPNHYLDLNLLKEDTQDSFSINLNELYLLRKKDFPNFQFLIMEDNNIVFSEISNFNSIIFQQNIYLIRANSKNKNLSLNLNGNSSLIIEDVAIKNSPTELTINTEGNNNFYYFTNYQLKNVFYSTININVSGGLKSLFITKPQLKKHKNKITYHLKEGSELVHNSFTENTKGQLQDDSIEVIHTKKSISKINYISLNHGKVSTQVNSVIPADADNCETYQLLSHLVLEPNAITNSKPNLVIKNKNVLASHGNNIGGFNPEHLFYLKQRGIDDNTSKKILAKSKYFNIIQDDSLLNNLISYYDRG